MRRARPLTCERVGNLLAGLSVMVTVSLAHLHHPLWLSATAAICVNLVATAIVDRCPLKSLLVRLGLASERELGRREGAAVIDPPRVGGRPAARRAAGRITRILEQLEMDCAGEATEEVADEVGAARLFRGG